MMSEASRRAALYVRVSTDEQAAEGYSLEAQKSILEDHCMAEGLEIAGVYEDDGYSGRNANRPAYRRMMSEMDSWDVLVVLKMDRIHRNSRNFMAMMDELGRNGKEFVSCYEALDTSNALGRFVVDMIQRMAQLESEQIGERTKIGMREKAENLGTEPVRKATMGFTPPFGYSLSDGQLVEDEEELPRGERLVPHQVLAVPSLYEEGPPSLRLEAEAHEASPQEPRETEGPGDRMPEADHPLPVLRLMRLREGQVLVANRKVLQDVQRGPEPRVPERGAEGWLLHGETIEEKGEAEAPPSYWTPMRKL